MSLEIILGPMFAGKSSEILKKVKREHSIGRKVLIITSSLDVRYITNTNLIKTHDSQTMEANALSNIEDIFRLTGFESSHLVIIEEAQFFAGLYDVVQRLVEVYKKNVIVVGLDGDSNRNPFGDILQLIPICDRVIKLNALCKRCSDGTEAIFSARIANAKTDTNAKESSTICIGGEEMYMPLCRKHFIENSHVCFS
jgi:thymidine kinase